MGCDIHIVVEQRWEDRWVGVATSQGFMTDSYLPGPTKGYPYAGPAVGQRNYAFFGRLAGVRASGPPPQGFPDDASDLSLMLAQQWGDDGHSHSWLPLWEFADRWCSGSDDFIAQRAKDRLGGKATSEHRLLDRASIGTYDSEAGMENFRVVFWFDN